MLVDLIYNEVLQRYEASYPSVGTPVVIASSLSGSSDFTNPEFLGQLLAADGTSALPAYSFTSEPTLGFWRSSATIVTLQGGLTVTGDYLSTGGITAGSAQRIGFNNQGGMISSSNGVFKFRINDVSTGSTFKVDALPTIASGFGTSPSIVAGSTPLAGSIDVGTGGAATTGVINFNGTAFPTAPYVVVTTKLTNAVTRVSAISTTQLTLSSTTAWTANDIISWVAISAK